MINSDIQTTKNNLTLNRIPALDVIRTFAIFSVILTHALDSTYTFWDLKTIPFLSPWHRIIVLALRIIGRCGVPLFFFLTGYLVLTKNFSTKESILNFYQRNLIPLFITSSIWGIIYYIYGIFIDHKPFSIGRFLRELLFFQQYEGTQFWYIPVILGIYIFIPFVSVVLNSVDRHMLSYIALFAFLYLFIPPMINPILAASGHSTLSSLLDLSWSGNKYGFLVLTGYWLKNNSKSIKLRYVLFSGIISFLLLLIEEDYCFTHGKAYDLWYDNILLVILCIVIFRLLSSIKHIIFSSLFTWISKRSFGIFLVHRLFLMWISKHMLNVIFWKKFLILLALTIILSIIAVFLLGINKKASRIVILSK